MTVSFRPMRGIDAMTIERQPSQRVQLGLDRVMTIEMANDLAEGGEAWTAWRGTTPVACVGLRETFSHPTSGRGVQAVAWAILSLGLGSDHLAITRFTRRRIAASIYRRIVLSELVSRRLSTGASGNVILTPLGTKAQVLGFTLFFIHECNGLPASIIFPFSSEYAPETSTGLARAWHYQIEF